MRLLKCGQEIARVLIHAYCAWYREYINQRGPDPRQYSVGNIVFTKRALKSVKKQGLVGKLMDSYTGPWKICGKGKGSSYQWEHIDSKKAGKQHAAHLLPYPDELLPFFPMDGPVPRDLS